MRAQADVHAVAVAVRGSPGISGVFQWCHSRAMAAGAVHKGAVHRSVSQGTQSGVFPSEVDVAMGAQPLRWSEEPDAYRQLSSGGAPGWWEQELFTEALLSAKAGLQAAPVHMRQRFQARWHQARRRFHVLRIPCVCTCHREDHLARLQAAPEHVRQRI